MERKGRGTESGRCACYIAMRCVICREGFQFKRAHDDCVWASVVENLDRLIELVVKGSVSLKVRNRKMEEGG